MSNFFSRSHLRGMWRSFTIWFGGLLMVLPEFIPYVHQNWPDFAQVLPDALASKANVWIGMLVIVLRFKTTKSLAEKG